MTNLKELLNKTTATEEEKKEATEIFEQYNTTDKELANTICKETVIRKRMKNAGLYTYEYGVKENFLGKGTIETRNLKLWNSYGKTRIYFDLHLDGVFATNTYIAVK